MKYYIVFGARKWENVLGKKGVTWEGEAVGVFTADNPDDACLAAAKKTGQLGTFIAIEGHPWGLDMVQDPEVSELGKEPDTMSRLEAMGRRLENRLAEVAQLAAPQQKSLPDGER